MEGIAGRMKYLNTAGVWGWQSSALGAVDLSVHPKPAMSITSKPANEVIIDPEVVTGVNPPQVG